MATLFDPESEYLPKLDELQPIEGAPKYASWFWGPHDEVWPNIILALASAEALSVPTLTLQYSWDGSIC